MRYTESSKRTCASFTPKKSPIIRITAGSELWSIEPKMKRVSALRKGPKKGGSPLDGKNTLRKPERERSIGSKPRKLQELESGNDGDDDVLDVKQLEKIDPLLAAEDREIKRLEKLLGISRSSK